MTSPSDAPRSPLDLSQCEREPVHLPGAIQPHGVLLVLDPRALQIVGVSENAADLLGHAPAALLGRDLADVAGHDGWRALADALRANDAEDPSLVRLRAQDGRALSVTARRYDGRVLIECEPEDTTSEADRARLYEHMRGALERLRASPDLGALCETAAREIRALTGFDRVLVYAFQPDWVGDVVAEACDDGRARYRGLRFPASDIPRQARALYTACRLRTIPTSSYVPARVLGLPDARPLDLTHAQLRSVSPVHLEYMRNMGVTASLGISLMREDRLWGLITCNHASGPRATPPDARIACGILGEVVSALIGQKEGMALAEARGAYLGVQARLLQAVVQDGDVVRGLTGHATSILDVVGSTGAALYYQGEVHCVGRTPPRDELLALLAWIEAQGTAAVVCDSLPARYAPAHAWKDVGCGLLAASVALPESRVVRERSQVLWFRPEVVQTIAWGGDPHTHARAGGDDRLHPRASFARWMEEVHLTSVPFTPADVAAASSLAAALTDVVLEIEANRQIREHARQLDVSNRELRVQIDENQRVGRVLAARTELLRRREASLQLVLDATGEGLVSVALDGRLLPERSRAVAQWFGVLREPTSIAAVLFPDDAAHAAAFEAMWSQLAADELPFELSVDQMPREIVRAGRSLELGYRAVREGEALASILVTLEDVTERAAARREAAVAAEAQAILRWVLDDARGFGRTLTELGGLARAVRDPASSVDARRALHSLKGNAAVLGLTALQQHCHALETQLADRAEGAAVTDADTTPLDAELHRVVERVHELAGSDALERVEIPIGQLAAAIQIVERGGSRDEVLAELRRWTLESVARPLGKLAVRARGLARTLGKEIEVVVVDGDVRVDPEAFEPVWSALAHAVSNAVDHGIESESERHARGKPARGRITLSAASSGDGWVTLEVRDDGAGVDLAATRAAAERRGLPCATRSELLDALFADDLSTRTVVTATSGRGVGLAALRETCTRLGGTVDLATDEGTGTRLRVRVPAVARRAAD